MKIKNMIISLIVLICMMISLAGCGILRNTPKTYEEQAAEYYEKELGLSKADAEDLAGALWSEEPTEKADKKDKETNDFCLYPVLPEIEKSNITDEIVQVNDVLINLDGSKTLDDVMNILKSSQEGSKMVFYRETDSGKTEYQEDGLLDADGLIAVNVYCCANPESCDMRGEQLCRFTAKNFTENTVEYKDAIVYDLRVGDVPYSFNIFYAGNINAGIHQGSEKAIQSEYYGQNATMDQLTYDTILPYLNEQGFSNPEYDEKEHKYQIEYLSDLGNGFYKKSIISFKYNQDTRKCTYSNWVETHSGEVQYKNIKSLDEITNDEVDKWIAEANEKMQERYDNASSIELVGAYINDAWSSFKIGFLYQIMDDVHDPWYCASTVEGIWRCYDGSLDYRISVENWEDTSVDDYLNFKIYEGEEALIPIEDLYK